MNVFLKGTRWQICLKAVGILAILSISHMVARADDVDHLTVLGHQLAIKDDPAGKALYIDGKNIMADFMIGIDGTTLIVDGQPVVLASDANGGNGCEISPFYISFPATGVNRTEFAGGHLV